MRAPRARCAKFERIHSRINYALAKEQTNGKHHPPCSRRILHSRLERALRFAKPWPDVHLWLPQPLTLCAAGISRHKSSSPPIHVLLWRSALAGSSAAISSIVLRPLPFSSFTQTWPPPSSSSAPPIFRSWAFLSLCSLQNNTFVVFRVIHANSIPQLFCWAFCNVLRHQTVPSSQNASNPVLIVPYCFAMSAYLFFQGHAPTCATTDKSGEHSAFTPFLQHKALVKTRAMVAARFYSSELSATCHIFGP